MLDEVLTAKHSRKNTAAYGERKQTPSEQQIQNLYRAVLERAARDVLGSSEQPQRARGYRTRQQVQAFAWFASSDTQHPFSFLNVCLVLDLDPQHVSQSVREIYLAENTE